jgi:preprotein translocase subunit YajC
MDIFLFFLQDAAGAPAAGAPQAGPGSSLGMMVPLVLMFVVMYFLMIRPQRKQQKLREEMIRNIKKNDHVLLASGIHGIVKQIKADDPVVTLCVDERKDVCIRVNRASITDLVKTSGTAEPEPAAEVQEKAQEKKS